MFTGIIERLAIVKQLSLKAGGAELFLDFSDFFQDVQLGESIAVNGVCLTAKAIHVSIHVFDVSGETLKKTTLKGLRHAETVNIERALRVGDRLGGHFVTGHVDGIGTVKEKRQADGQCSISFMTEKRLTDMMIEKGSVAVDGISLTIVDVVDGAFTVALIPFTLASTTLGSRKNGDAVNVEVDMMGKWIKRLLKNTQENKPGISEGRLIEQGFL